MKRAPVAVTTQVLGGKEGGATDIPHGAGFGLASVGVEVGCSDGLGGVLDDIEVVFAGQLQQRVHGGALPEEMHRDYGFGSGPYGGLDLLGVQGKGYGVHIHQNGGQPQQGDGLGSSHIGEGSRDQFVPRLEVQGHHGDLQGIRSVGTGNDVHPVPQVCFQFGGKGLDLRAVDEGRVFDDFGDVAVHFLSDLKVLGTEVNHGTHRQGVQEGQEGDRGRKGGGARFQRYPRARCSRM